MTSAPIHPARRLARRALEPALAGAWWMLRKQSSRRSSVAAHRLVVMPFSFDGYQRFWAPLRYFTERALPSSLPRFWVGETIPLAPDDHGEQVLVGKATFVPRMRLGVERLESDYVLLLQEDIWLDQPVSQEQLDDLVEVMDRHQLDCLKLGWSSFVPEDKELIEANTDLLPGESRFRWFGGHPYSMSHHASIFRTSYLVDTCKLAERFRITNGLRHEHFISTFFEGRAKARNNDSRGVRIAVWSDEPVISYAHAGWQGKLTPEGRALLEAHDKLDLYDHSADGADPPKLR